MSNKCNHVWNYEGDVFAGRTEDECTVRRFCNGCGVVQHAYTGRWYKSSIGTGKMWGEYPNGYTYKRKDTPNGQ